jgi:hypothetical protein
LDEKVYREFVFTLQNNAQQGFDVSYALKMQLNQRQKSLDFYGKVMAFFVICSCASIYFGIYNLWQASQDPDYKLQIDLMAYLLPFVSFVIDASVKRVYMVEAKTWY